MHQNGSRTHFSLVTFCSRCTAGHLKCDSASLEDDLQSRMGVLIPQRCVSVSWRWWWILIPPVSAASPWSDKSRKKTDENPFEDYSSSPNMVAIYNTVNLMRISLTFKACPCWMASEISWEVQKYLLLAVVASLILLDMTYWGPSHSDFQSLQGLEAKHSYILRDLE